MHRSCRLIPAVLATGVLFAQSLPAPQFEVASVKPSPQGAPEQMSIGVHVDGARVSCSYLSLRDYIRMAYRVKDYQIVAPEWVGTERYEIAATLPPGGTREQVPDMIRILLADRFQLKAHQEKKDFPAYALVVDKGGLKIRESPLDTDADGLKKDPVNVTASGSRNGVSLNLGHGSFFTFADNKLEAKKLTMTSLAETMARFVDRPIVDMTGLTGTYDLVLNFTEDDYRAMLIRSALDAGVMLPPQARQAMEAASGDSLFTAIQTAGLKLERRKEPLDVMVIDRAEKIPSEN